MTKLNSVIFNKLAAQAEEAETRGLTKLADNIKQAIGSEAAAELISYSYNQLNNDINKDLWKLATRLIAYYNLESVDADKLQDSILGVTSQIINNLEEILGVSDVALGPLEPNVPGEIKLAELTDKELEDLEQEERYVGTNYPKDTLRELIDKQLSKKCINCGHHEDEHWTNGVDGEYCQGLVGGGYRMAPRKCDCMGFNLKS